MVQKIEIPKTSFKTKFKEGDEVYNVCTSSDGIIYYIQEIKIEQVSIDVMNPISYSNSLGDSIDFKYSILYSSGFDKVIPEENLFFEKEEVINVCEKFIKNYKTNYFVEEIIYEENLLRLIMSHREYRFEEDVKDIEKDISLNDFEAYLDKIDKYFENNLKQ